MDELYNPQEGTVLGRTAGSWAKILVFYGVYYSFLFVLFYVFTIVGYQGTLPEAMAGKKPYVNTRTDQPGAAVHPFNELRDFKRGAYPNEVVIDENDDNNYVNSTNYVNQLEQIFAARRKLNERSEAVKCDDTNNAEEAGSQRLCKLDTIPDIEIIRKNLVDRRKPMVVVDLNKIIGWKPRNIANQKPIRAKTSPNSAIKDAVFLDCYQWKVKAGEKAKEQEFVFKFPNGRNFIEPYYFPFVGDKEDNPYNKPFIAFYVEMKEKTDGKGAWVPGTQYNFRCEIYADNISRPTMVDGKVSREKADQDLVNMAIGVVQFDIQFAN